MRRSIPTLALAALALACDPPTPACPGGAGGPAVGPDVVCAHLEAIECFIEEDPSLSGFDDPSCEAGYADVAAQVPAEELERLVACYMVAEDCEAVELCNRACGPDGGPIGFDAGDGLSRFDAALPEGGLPDAGPPPPDAGSGEDAGPDPEDAGPPDAGPPDAGPPDAGPPDAGVDAGPPEAGPPDSGPPDAGPPDAGPPDAGVDAGDVDAGA